MSVEIEGFEEFSDQIERTIESTDGEYAVSFDEIFADDFMRTHTAFDSIGAFFAESPWTVESAHDFRQIPGTQFDRYVHRHTGFNSWDTMLSAAAREWLSRQLSR